MINFRLLWNTAEAHVLRVPWERKQEDFVCESGWACDYVYPYGFVPEDGCPTHDPLSEEHLQGLLLLSIMRSVGHAGARVSYGGGNE